MVHWLKNNSFLIHLCHDKGKNNVPFLAQSHYSFNTNYRELGVNYSLINSWMIYGNSCSLRHHE